MDCIHDFMSDISIVFDQCEKRIQGYPAYIRQIGLQYLEAYHMFAETGKKNYICYLLPFWLQETFKVDAEVSKKIASGNIFAMLYFYIQDALMDDALLEHSNTELLSLCNVLYWDFLGHYLDLFSSDSPFWDYLRQYTLEWTESIHWEKQEHQEIYKEFSDQDFFLIAHKAAPLKITFAALSLLSNQAFAIDQLTSLVDRLLIQLQLLDDWHDWKKDLADGNCTYLLTEAMKYCNIRNYQELTETHVKKAIYVGKIFDKIYALVNLHYGYIQTYSTELDIHYIQSFSSYMMKDYHSIVQHIQSHRDSMLNGGFHYWLNTR